MKELDTAVKGLKDVERNLFTANDQLTKDLSKANEKVKQLQSKVSKEQTALKQYKKDSEASHLKDTEAKQ